MRHSACIHLCKKLVCGLDVGDMWKSEGKYAELKVDMYPAGLPRTPDILTLLQRPKNVPLHILRRKDGPGAARTETRRGTRRC